MSDILFSAAGNCKYVVRQIANKTGDRALSIIDCIKNEQFSFTVSKGERLGFVLPVYHWGLPMLELY